MTTIIIIGVVFGIGAIFMLRSPSAPPVPTITPADAALLRDQVLERLRERLVGWTFDAPADNPREITAVEAATERRIQMNLQQLGDAWFPYHSRQQKAEADEQIDAFILGATGQSEGEESELDDEGLRDVLALQLTKADAVPPGAITRPAGELIAVLVMRNIGGFDTINAASLESMKLSGSEAFKLAFENLQRDVEEGLELEVLDDGEPPGALAVAPKDPLAPAYALIPGLPARLRKKLGNRDGKLYLDRTSLVAAVEGTELERDRPLLADGQALDALTWKAPPQ